VKQDKVYCIGMLGLTEQEARMIKSMLRLSGKRPQGSYALVEDVELRTCDVVLVNADDEKAMSDWQSVAESPAAPVLVLVTNNAMVYSTEHYFVRPFGPAKMLALLDRIVAEIKVHDPAQQIFAGKDTFVPAQPAAGGDAASAQSRRRALVVDDSPTVRKQLEIELQASNIQVDSVETGEEGLDLVESNLYDIIFLDVVLPGADGYQICKSIKKNPAAKLTPVVMLTSKSSPFDRVRGSLAGCDTYLTKPVDYEKFRQVLVEHQMQ
jgi:twitching motility two-component system response regulator PilG